MCFEPRAQHPSNLQRTFHLVISENSRFAHGLGFLSDSDYAPTGLVKLDAPALSPPPNWLCPPSPPSRTLLLVTPPSPRLYAKLISLRAAGCRENGRMPEPAPPLLPLLPLAPGTCIPPHLLQRLGPKCCPQTWQWDSANRGAKTSTTIETAVSKILTLLHRSCDLWGSSLSIASQAPRMVPALQHRGQVHNERHKYNKHTVTTHWAILLGPLPGLHRAGPGKSQLGNPQV
jgi:hypothetical protein